jgi:NAD kinase
VLKSLPRIVLVTRKTPLELLLITHGTLGQAKFYLESRGQDINQQQEIHQRFLDGLVQVMQQIPSDVKRVRVDRDELDRFLFGPDDLVLIVGQDGLVPNAAKYLSGQLTVGINPAPEHYDGVLCRHNPDGVAELLDWLMIENADERYRVQNRSMARATREDGQFLLALNDIFIGHRSHQSARYLLTYREQDERQSSSGIICSTGTGSTGWARSISEQRQINLPLPGPEDRILSWFVREPFPSVWTGTELTFDYLGENEQLRIVSEMGSGGLIFADGIESDYVEFLDGQSVNIEIARQTLNLLVPVEPEIPEAEKPPADQEYENHDEPDEPEKPDEPHSPEDYR